MLSPKQIKKEIERIHKKLDALYVEKYALQNHCLHPNAITKFKSDLGNYDSTLDCFWEEYECPDCTKRWSSEIQRAFSRNSGRY